MKYEKLLLETAGSMVKKGKGILAADESSPTCNKRFESIGVESSYAMRNEYRDLLLTADGLEKYISGVIMFDETFRQSTTSEKKIAFPDFLASKNILPGIKVDTGAKDLAGFKNEKITEGLDGLRERLSEYFSLGARFAKWRSVINIDNNLPSLSAIIANTHALARYASLCQENGIVQYSKKYNDIKNESVIYTSGVGSLFKAGIPIGKINDTSLSEEKKVQFFSDFSQLRFVKVFSFIKNEVE